MYFLLVSLSLHNSKTVIEMTTQFSPFSHETVSSLDLKIINLCIFFYRNFY